MDCYMSQVYILMQSRDNPFSITADFLCAQSTGQGFPQDIFNKKKFPLPITLHERNFVSNTENPTVSSPVDSV